MEVALVNFFLQPDCLPVGSQEGVHLAGLLCPFYSWISLMSPTRSPPNCIAFLSFRSWISFISPTRNPPNYIAFLSFVAGFPSCQQPGVHLITLPSYLFVAGFPSYYEPGVHLTAVPFHFFYSWISFMSPFRSPPNCIAFLSFCSWISFMLPISVDGSSPLGSLNYVNRVYVHYTPHEGKTVGSQAQQVPHIITEVLHVGFLPVRT